MRHVDKIRLRRLKDRVSVDNSREMDKRVSLHVYIYLCRRTSRMNFVEKVFGIPGIGNLFTNSILNRDYTLIMGITVFFSIILVICILVVDILYVLIDPRIKYQ